MTKEVVRLLQKRRRNRVIRTANKKITIHMNRMIWILTAEIWNTIMMKIIQVVKCLKGVKKRKRVTWRMPLRNVNRMRPPVKLAAKKMHKILSCKSRIKR